MMIDFNRIIHIKKLCESERENLMTRVRWNINQLNEFVKNGSWHDLMESQDQIIRDMLSCTGVVVEEPVPSIITKEDHNKYLQEFMSKLKKQCHCCYLYSDDISENLCADCIAFRDRKYNPAYLPDDFTESKDKSC